MCAHPCFSKLFDTSMASFLNVSPQFLAGVVRHGKTSKTEKIKSLIFKFVPYTNTDRDT